MKTRSIGSLFNHVADLDPDGGVATKSRIKWSEELELDRADAQELITNAAKGLRRSIALDETMRELFNYLKDIMK